MRNQSNAPPASFATFKTGTYPARFTSFRKFPWETGILTLDVGEFVYVTTSGKKISLIAAITDAPDSDYVRHLGGLIGRGPTVNEIRDPTVWLNRRVLLRIGRRAGRSVILSCEPP
jgi:hypothetical protein